MYLVIIVLVSAVILIIAYKTYGSLLARLFKLDPDAQTPAVEFRDDVDFVPIEPKFLLGQHFSAIAAAGPIVGPILAGVMFGWVPALIWIIIGSIFIGGVHDLGSLVASVRHKARSIAEVVSEYMSRGSYILFLIFVWITLVYIIVAFTDIVASSFVGSQTLENGMRVTGGGIATSSLMYLALPLVMGLLLKFTKISLSIATLIFLPLVGVAIWAGQYIPFDLAALLDISESDARRLWDVILLGYCFIASMVPMWLLLQPRGHLGGYFLYIALAAGILGIIFGGKTIQYPAFTGLVTGKDEHLFPLLFITIACGACSGFHALVASGTTSKQLKKETDAKVIGYGGMLLEAMVAVISLGCVMMLAADSSVFKGGVKANMIYGVGIGSFLEVIHVPVAFGISFGLLAFTTFVYDTLDVSTRLGRYILQELVGARGRIAGYVATLATVGTPILFVMRETKDAAGNVIPAWKVFWPLFGASNQLLAALALVAVTVWIYSKYHRSWVWFVTIPPAVFMYVMSIWALLSFVRKGFFDAGWEYTGLSLDPVPYVAFVLVLLAMLILIEAVRAFAKQGKAGNTALTGSAAG